MIDRYERLEKALVEMQTALRVGKLQWLAALVPTDPVRDGRDLKLVVTRLANIRKLMALRKPPAYVAEQVSPKIKHVKALVSSLQFKP
jgi:hypothetical protein